MQLAPSVRELRIRFVGSGSEYFRIWIVNLLLMLVTLGIYYPRARLRRLRYFYGSTEVDGRPLAFHGDVKRVVRGYWLAVALAVVYSVASQASPPAAGVAAVALGGLWPMLWRSSLRFRLANTGWSGLRGAFTGSTAGAYAAFWPLLVPAAVTTAVALLAGPDDKLVNPWPVLAVMAASLLPVPLGLWQMKRYQHSHITFGSEHTRFKVGVGAVYGVLLRGALLAAVCIAAGLGLAFLLFAGGLRAGGARLGTVAAFALPLLVSALVLLLLQAVVRPYVTARLQNLFWNGTRSDHLRPYSRLKARSLVALSLRNWLLVLLTLGLYLPFAAVATARLRLESVRLLSKLDPDELIAGLRQQESAVGDAAADAFGLDMGL